MPGAAARPSITLPPASGSSAHTGAAPGAAPAVTTSDVVVVDVAGAVARPGLYRLPSGARVDDAVTAAGGPGPNADLEAVNLAAPVADGDRVFVPRQGEPGDPAGDTGTTAPQIVNLNSATTTQLDALPGVGPSLASAILEYRRQHGRFATIDELLQVPGVGPAKLAALRPHLRV
jgi:competence protein ComEA